MAQKSFVAVDWGTSSRRIYVIEGGTVVADEQEDCGVTRFARDDFPAEIAALRRRFDGRPLLLCGMIGSNRGWVEAPYVPCPASLDDVRSGAIEPDDGVFIIPGVAYDDGTRCDVMRGEEVPLFGSVARGLVDPDALLCHPGTHNKWVELERGRVAAFRTVMTGELFALLRQHSILGELLQGDPQPGAAFRRGVDHALKHADLPAALFGARADHLLARREDDPASYVSGLLIGTDIAIGLDNAVEHRGPVAIMARRDLALLYQAALDVAGREGTLIDSDESFVAGVGLLAGELL
ncbi:2-dehydro-3-deoxygalactonokinase [Sphingobium subterraneum]|uniref:2-dehydro-3-deoxygalactonokinase n=1 Tax=Sphingobium subterraneum TaxID=627688 RepID=A0A841J6M0_9SPHN|nr:2-dehydro-3-deoxygalactonokinase [Sphingobium subterraneum]